MSLRNQKLLEEITSPPDESMDIRLKHIEAQNETIIKELQKEKKKTKLFVSDDTLH